MTHGLVKRTILGTSVEIQVIVILSEFFASALKKKSERSWRMTGNIRVVVVPEIISV